MIQKLTLYCKQWSSPPFFYRRSQVLISISGLLALLMLAYGSIWGLFVVPPDAQQGDAFRILYVHVPSAIFSLLHYTMLSFFSVLYLVFNLKIADVLAKSIAPLGASFTLLALITGAIWGKPMWGTWWVWDARLTSELILLFLYAGYIGLRNAIPDQKKAGKIAGLLSVLGVVNVPIIHFSVNWWYTLHQGASISKWGRPDLAPQMLWPLLGMLLGFACFSVFIILQQARLTLKVDLKDP